MKNRVRFGFRLNLPFGWFRNAATFVFHATPEQVEQLNTKVRELQGVLILAGQPEIASRFFVEVSS
jgi:hypothetical protein